MSGSVDALKWPYFCPASGLKAAPQQPSRLPSFCAASGFVPCTYKGAPRQGPLFLSSQRPRDCPTAALFLSSQRPCPLYIKGGVAKPPPLSVKPAASRLPYSSPLSVQRAALGLLYRGEGERQSNHEAELEVSWSCSKAASRRASVGYCNLRTGRANAELELEPISQLAVPREIPPEDAL
jgi:hypothetical protein